MMPCAGPGPTRRLACIVVVALTGVIRAPGSMRPCPCAGDNASMLHAVALMVGKLRGLAPDTQLIDGSCMTVTGKTVKGVPLKLEVAKR